MRNKQPAPPSRPARGPAGQHIAAPAKEFVMADVGRKIGPPIPAKPDGRKPK